MALTVLRKVSDRNLTKRFLTALLTNSKTERHYRVVSTPSHTAAVENIATPPGPDAEVKLSERLDTNAAFGLLAYERSTIPTVTTNGLVVTPMIDITHINPKLLPHALEQEETYGANDSTLDLRVWMQLPKIIKDHWRRFNPELRAYIMSCMDKYVRNPNKNVPDYTGTFFATPSHNHFPHIPVKFLPLGLKNSDAEVQDLMQVLASGSISRIDYKQLTPASSPTEELRFSISALRTGI